MERTAIFVSRTCGQVVLRLGLCWPLFIAGRLLAEIEPDWSGEGRLRVLVAVLPVSELQRPDELVAACELPLDDWLRQENIDGAADIASFQIHQYDPTSGKPLEGVAYDSARSPFDRPCRFEDNQYPAQYPSRVGRASE